MRMHWVKGAALETVKALGELKAGDMVQIGSSGEESLDSRLGRIEGVWFIHSIDDHDVAPINLSRQVPNGLTDWEECVNIKNILAWRRP